LIVSLITMASSLGCCCLFEFGWCCWFWVWGSYRSISCSSFNVACLRERERSFSALGLFSSCLFLCVSWNAMTWGDLSQCHQQQPPAPRGVVEITRLSQTWWAVSLSCMSEWAQRPWLVLLAWLISTSPQRRYLIIIMMMTMMGWRSWGLVGSLGWSMKTSNIKWYWGLVLAHTHTLVCVQWE